MGELGPEKPHHPLTPSSCTDLRLRPPAPLPPQASSRRLHLRPSPAPTPLPAVWIPILSPHTHEGLFQPHSTGSPSPAPGQSLGHVGTGKPDATRLQGLLPQAAPAPRYRPVEAYAPTGLHGMCAPGQLQEQMLVSGTPKRVHRLHLEVLEGPLGRQGEAIAHSRRKKTGREAESILFIFSQ